MVSFKEVEMDRVSFFDKNKITELVKKQGFVIVNCKGSTREFEHKVLEMSDLLSLGEVNNSQYNKHYFSEKISKDYGLNIIGTQKEYKSSIYHKAFESKEGQDLHVDGTFSEIGYVRLMMLYCKNPAIKGGETNLFNVLGAINDIKDSGISIEPLFQKNALRRVSKYEGVIAEHTDCIIKFDQSLGRYIVRFADDITCEWDECCKNVNGLSLLLNELRERAYNKGAFKLTFKLEKDEMLIVDNVSLAHGRNAFIESSDSPRIMVRGTFRNGL